MYITNGQRLTRLGIGDKTKFKFEIIEFTLLTVLVFLLRLWLNVVSLYFIAINGHCQNAINIWNWAWCWNFSPPLSLLYSLYNWYTWRNKTFRFKLHKCCNDLASLILQFFHLARYKDNLPRWKFTKSRRATSYDENTVTSKWLVHLIVMTQKLRRIKDARYYAK